MSAKEKNNGTGRRSSSTPPDKAASRHAADVVDEEALVDDRRQHPRRERGRADATCAHAQRVRQEGERGIQEKEEEETHSPKDTHGRGKREQRAEHAKKKRGQREG